MLEMTSLPGVKNIAGNPFSSTPSKKRLITEAKPKHNSTTISPNSSQSSRTRELPNLSNCHGCNLRINYSNPKDRLQTLGSVWRIVLLCKKCIKRVESGQMCPYCFKETADLSCLRCRDCGRRIHERCVERYENLSPWLYYDSKLELGFKVCIDCWVPKLLHRSYRFCSRRKGEKVVQKVNSDLGGGSSVPGDVGGDSLLKEAVNHASGAAGKKFLAAEKAKEKALRKAVVARNAVEFANNALYLVAEKDRKSKVNKELIRYSSDSSNSCDVATVNGVLHDAELAFKLHRAMNSSPRISRNLCLMNSRSWDVSKLSDPACVLGNSRPSDVENHDDLSTSKFCEENDKNIPGASICVEANGSGSIDSSRFKQELITYKSRRLKRKHCQESSNVITYKRGCLKKKGGHKNDKVKLSSAAIGKCHFRNDSGVPKSGLGQHSDLDQKVHLDCFENHEHDSSIPVIKNYTDDHKIVPVPQLTLLNDLKPDLRFVYSRKKYPVKCESDFKLEHKIKCVKPDLYLVKYSRRLAGSKQGMSHGNSSYYKFRNKNQEFAPALHIHSSTESRVLTSYDDSFHSSEFSVQVSPSVSGSTQGDS